MREEGVRMRLRRAGSHHERTDLAVQPCKLTCVLRAAESERDRVLAMTLDSHRPVVS